VKCFYHRADFDGHCSAAIVRNFAPLLSEEGCGLIGVDYGDDFGYVVDSVREGEVVFVVDFCFPTPIMAMLQLKTRLVWLDHHISAIRAMEDGGLDPVGMRSTTLAGCECCWEFFTEQLKYLLPALEGSPPPEAVRLLGRYDVWDIHRDPAVLQFQYGMRVLEDTNVETAQELWTSVLQGDPIFIAERCAEGEIVLRYIRTQDAKYCSAMAREIELAGHRVIALNRGMCNSQVFDSVWDPAKYDAMLAYSQRKDGRWVMSLYSDKPEMDVSELAKSFGGGGHEGAAGWHSDVAPSWVLTRFPRAS